MVFRSEVRTKLERLENGDLKIRFGCETMPDLTIGRSGVPKEKIGAEARSLLGASLAECMGSTLLFLVNWAKIDLRGFEAMATVSTGKDQKGRVCVDIVNVEFDVRIPKDEETMKRFEKVKRLFKRGCLMSRSLANGVRVNYSINT